MALTGGAPLFRSVAAAVLGVGAALVLILFVTDIYPARTWLLGTVSCLWAWQLYLALAFVAAGDLLVSRVLRLRELTSLPRLALAAPAGAMVFALGMFLAGFLAIYGAVFAVLWPALMILASTALHGRRSWPSWWQAARRAPVIPRNGATAWMTVVSTAFGTLALGLLYLEALTPDSVNYDAAWSHLVVAQDYAREGRIVPFVANWPASLPHLASIFYTWGFLVPGLGRGAPRWMMALHTEFAFLIWTLVGVAAAVQVCLQRAVRGAWAAFFLFPGIFVYDNNLGAAADHVLAFFAAPALIAAALGTATLYPGWWALFGLIAAGGLMTKLQSAYFLLPSGALLAVGLCGGVWNWVRRRGPQGQPSGPPAALGMNPRHLWQAPLAALVTVLAVTSPHFIRNWVFYRNPLYPMAQRFFSGSRPTIKGAALLAENIISHWGTKPPGPLGARLRQALELFWTFSFRPHAGFTGNVPVVGSLFTLCLPLVLVASSGAKRLRVVVALAAAAVFLWAFTYWVDRNLQGFVPVLAVATCGLLIRTWELGRLGRIGVIALVGVQLAWSSDHFFNGSDRINSALSLIRSGYDGRAVERFNEYRRPYVEMGQALPPRARVLLHSIHGSLGIDREVLLDWPGFQGLIDPRESRTPRELYDRYRALGITHVVYQPGLHPSPVKQDDVVFGAFRARYESVTRIFGPFHMFEIPRDPPPVEPPYQVLVAGIGGYDDGIYAVENLATLEGMPPDLEEHFSPAAHLVAGQVASQMDTTQALLLGNAVTLEPAANIKVDTQFQVVVGYSQFRVLVRR